MEVPSEYGYVILCCGVLPTIMGMHMGGYVMKARKEYDVQYPNCYGTPGYHKKADEFNRVQRGHMNYTENLLGYTVMAFTGGLKYPIVVAVGGVLYSFGSLLYLKGYSDTALDVKMARYKKGGAIKWIGFFSSFYASVSMAGSMIGWW
mmetsp:Transcript_16904/g.23178  ORF Transcript_16904/g.23178 Transcript_16904/m.23178 type:complete len:148 (-) Transcript_16904:155-598(-)|eukprot:CAMPEP_0185727846 /NCGR_PEP_ID=MMETSP1171-20130828/3410_1 /TAXON_ID=374046 /ORGANISM="Helicotheca tamensis, Strain CCMP826" /LENGTH=147 /DNA_ID=CAMNT_0028396485 /DNA_START=74 /DNA_END=517 /DNA_ORIENTATION=+